MTPGEFIAKWKASERRESLGAQEHFLDLCRVLGEPTPAEADPAGERYCFGRGARKDSGDRGWADVWKRGCFAWEYKGTHANLDAALDRLRQYALALENPPLLIVSDMVSFRIHTNWTNSVSKTYEFTLDELADGATRDKLKRAMSDPERLRPGETRQAVTKKAAATIASVAQGLRHRGHDPLSVAQFVIKLVFCMFAQDVGLLAGRMFTKMLECAKIKPDEFVDLAGDLFRTMSTGGRIGYERVAWFNGELFEDDTALPLNRDEIRTLLRAAELDWSEIDPSILGTLFERGLDPEKRSQLGAHYTDRDKIMQIVGSVIVRPLLAEWEAVRGEVERKLKLAGVASSRKASTKCRMEADEALRSFLQRLREFTVLDPACGSGNFLYLALHALKGIEHRVQIEAESLGFPRQFPEVGPSSVRGIEINPYAAELARVSVWIGEIQWMRRNGFGYSTDPILDPLDTIECRDAILTSEGAEPDWPEADVVIGNPPFLGNRRIRRELRDRTADALPKLYANVVKGKPDLVCYWFAKAAKLVAEDRVRRVGLVATNSIRGGTNRNVLKYILEHGTIFEAWSDEPWVVEGAAVRVSIVCFSPANPGKERKPRLNGRSVDRIHADLTATVDGVGVDLTQARRLRSNKAIAFQGNVKRGSFDVPGDLAREWLSLPDNPNGRPNADVLKPWINGRDIMRRPAGKWIVDFGWTMSEADAALYEAPYSHVASHVYAGRQNTREPDSRRYWFRHWNPRPAMWGALEEVRRYVLTPRVAKHRVFVWCDAGTCPDSATVAIARDDDVSFGILHSRFHEAWSLRLGTWLGKGNDLRYTPTTTFETFPFPDGLSPDVPAAEYADDPRATSIAEAARRLVRLRDRWLNPPEWVEWVDEAVPGYPGRPVARDAESARQLESRTLTELYNTRPQWLADAHAELDEAVAAAYGWDADVEEESALRDLLALNSARSEG